VKYRWHLWFDETQDVEAHANIRCVMWWLLDQLGGIHLERAERFCQLGRRDAEILAELAG
jgi:hypothetical protein